MGIDVFNVPTGLAVNSEHELTVVGNRFRGTTASPVPLSGAFGLTMLAMNALGDVRFGQSRLKA